MSMEKEKSPGLYSWHFSYLPSFRIYAESMLPPSSFLLSCYPWKKENVIADKVPRPKEGNMRVAYFYRLEKDDYSFYLSCMQETEQFDALK